MEEYTLLRQFADSWMLLLLFVVFVGIIIWAFRPGSSKTHEDTANIPFRHVDSPNDGDTGPNAHKANAATDEEART
ncbi:cbb3-type cytochrome c oxidase subunit 3 [Ruegeria sp. 2012CJ41-6]|uniref:Cbb3-type cytochrome c oxidase subunit 3 n=1 Tax=Ruegeria spongiae TaxID=2942209 RepID=A0ABT0Q3F3_9RHOB|nr:cbb3-type cytochrome c oxidase subunit 3 [Ruegeria spongiae]MCL6283693.1 cbb3-type cytochrome c oxidase subunit 3 [Ruegeria spongiae]